MESRDRRRPYPAGAAFARVVGDQGGRVVFGDLAAAAGGALQGRVVDHHQFAVAGQVQVQFATVDAMLQAALEAGQGVFRRFALGAAMSIDESHCGSLFEGCAGFRGR